MILRLINSYEKTDRCFFFSLTYTRVSDILHFVISGRVFYIQIQLNFVKNDEIRLKVSSIVPVRESGFWYPLVLNQV